MNKLLPFIVPLLSGCVHKMAFTKKADNQEVAESIPNQEIVYLSPDESSFTTFIIIILGVMFFCFGLKYIPILYKKVKGLTKKN
jgi:hypothetical protein